MQIAAGIDGGGTGSTVVILDKQGKIVRRERFGSLNLNGIGEESFRETLRRIFDLIRETGSCSCLCAGLAGLSNAAVGRCFEEELRRFGLRADGDAAARWILCGDQEIALYGAGKGAPGIALIAGTGSVCTGMRADGSRERTGGWGHLIDDLGSGYDIGRRALHAAVAALDGRAQRTVLSEQIFQLWGLRTVQDLIQRVYSAPGKERIASLAPVVDAAAADDPVADSILEQAAEELWILVRTTEAKLRGKGASQTGSVSDHSCAKKDAACPPVLPVYFFGGLLTHETCLREKLLARIAASDTLTQKAPDMDAAEGAALMAYRALSGKRDMA